MGGYPLPAALGVGPAVATVAALPSVAPEGQLRWVLGRKRFYQRLGGDWLSRPETSDPTWASASLSISSSGDDDAPGTADAPIATLEEWGARTSKLSIGQATLTVLDDLAEEDATIGGACDGILDRWVYLRADPAVVLTTTIAAITGWTLNATTNTVGQMTGTASFAGYAGTSGGPGALWRIVGGARDGARGVFGSVESGSAVVFVPPISALYAVDTVTPQIGDTIEVLDPVRLCSRLRVAPGTRLSVDGLQIGDGGVHDVQAGAGAAMLASGCQFTGGVDALTGSLVEMTACGLDSSARAEGDGEGGGGHLSVRGCHARAILARPGGVLSLSDVVASYQISCEGWTWSQIVSGFVFFNNPTSAAALSLGKRATFDALGALNGRGVTASAARLIAQAGALFTYGAKPLIAGSGAEWSANATTGNFSALPVAGGAEGAFLVAR